MKGNIKRFIREEEALGTVELVVLIAVLIGIALLFKDKLASLVGDMFGKIDGKGKIDKAFDQSK